jgi:glycosyltransferase involved in cell wall biosynthesis
MEVSIVCPIHGDGKYLFQTLDSIKSQTFDGAMEVILVLDRCTSDVSATIEIFQDSLEIKVVISKLPGLVEALNTGLQFSNGKYVARIDSDDVMDPSRIEKQFNFLEANQQTTVLGSSVIEINEHGIVIGKRDYPIDSIQMYNSLSKQCTIAHPSVMFKRNDILKLGGYRTFFENAEDYDLWLRVRDHGTVLSLLEPLTFYRVHPDQISAVQMKQRVFGSYSARLNNFLEQKNMRNLISRYETFEKWNNSLEGGIMLKYVSFRLMVSREIKKFEKGEPEGRWLKKFIIGKIFLSAKNWRGGRKR